MIDQNGRIRPSLEPRDDRPEISWFEDGALGGTSADIGAGLVSLGFIRAALRRSRGLWGGLGVLGLLVGLALSLAPTPVSQASTTLILMVGPEAQPGAAILNDQTIAQSRGVADLALQDLGLHQSTDAFLASYSASVLTDRILRIDANAPTAEQAIRRANAIAGAFLKFRSAQLETLQDLQFQALDEDLARAQQRVDQLKAGVSPQGSRGNSPAQQSQADRLRRESDRATADLATLAEQVSGAKATSQETMAQMVGQSRVLDAARALPGPSRLRMGLLYGGGGLVAGLALGVAFVVVRVLVSDRLRAREDVAHALGARVKLSLPVKPRRIWRRGMAGARTRAMGRLVSFLDEMLRAGRPNRGLAVVPVDDPRLAALGVVKLAVAWVKQQERVVVVDLCAGAPIGRLIGVKRPGIHAASVDGEALVLVIPDPEDVAPRGPRGAHGSSGAAETAAQLADVYESADAVLVLAGLDPSNGSEHLTSWASDALVVVTAGRSSWTKIHAVAELVRLSGARLLCGVLLGADRFDESLGVSSSEQQLVDFAPVHAAAAVNGSPDHAHLTKSATR